MRRVDFKNDIIEIRFSGWGDEFRFLLTLVKSLTGREWQPNSKVWTAQSTPENIEKLKFAGFDFVGSPSLEIFPEKPQKPVQKQIEIPEELFKDFRPYQREGVRFLEVNNGVGLVADEMGLGKTVQAIGYFILHRDIRPVIIVCPASLKFNWQREIKKWTGENAEILTGESPYPIGGSRWYIINYDILATEDPEIRKHEKQRKAKYQLDLSALQRKFQKTIPLPPAEANKKALIMAQREMGKFKKQTAPLVGWIDTLVTAGAQAIVGDEVQALANGDSIRSRAFVQLGNQLPTKILLSGTPMRNRPKEFFTVLNFLAPEQFPNKYKYLFRYCDPVKSRFGWEFNGATNIEELRSKILPLMIRREKCEVLKDLPPKNKIIIPMELSPLELSRYRDADQEFQNWVKMHIRAGLEGKDQIEQLKQKAYLAKRAAVFQWVDEYLESGNKLVLFTFHRNAMADLLRRYPDAVAVYGGIPPEARQEAVDRFQNDPKTNLFIGQIVAAGTGLTLTAAPAVAFVEFPWTPADAEQAEDRIHRIGQKFDSVTAYYLVAANTVEEDIMGLLHTKNSTVKSLLDGKENVHLFGEDEMVTAIISKYRSKK